MNSTVIFGIEPAGEIIRGAEAPEAVLLRGAGVAAVPCELSALVIAAEARSISDPTIAYRTLSALRQPTTTPFVFLTEPGEALSTGILGATLALATTSRRSAALVLLLERLPAGDHAASTFVVHHTSAADGWFFERNVEGVRIEVGAEAIDSGATLRGILERRRPGARLSLAFETNAQGRRECRLLMLSSPA